MYAIARKLLTLLLCQWVYILLVQAVRSSLYGRPGPSYIEIPGDMLTDSIAANRVRYYMYIYM